MSYKIILPPSKSASARLLMASTVAKQQIPLVQISDCDDTRTLLKYLNTKTCIVDVGPSGTCMRFLMSYFASDPECHEIILTGSERMLARPIKQLVDILNSMGADISKSRSGWIINGKQLHGTLVDCKKLESSQFVSSLFFIIPRIEGTMIFRNLYEAPSSSYLFYTLDYLSRCEHYLVFERFYDVFVMHKDNRPIKIYDNVDGDWSALSFIYTYLISHDNINKIEIHNYQINQFTREIEEVAKQFGISTKINQNKQIAIIEKTKEPNEYIQYDFNSIPDEVPAFVVAAAMKKIPFTFNGCETLSKKECDRLKCLQFELYKYHIQTDITESGIMLYLSKVGLLNDVNYLKDKVYINTYNDHRIAMAFASCGVKKDLIINPDVVTKSWPNFWNIINYLDNE